VSVDKKAQPPANVEPLLAEARKYKTAEEFVKAQNKQYADELSKKYPVNKLTESVDPNFIQDKYTEEIGRLSNQASRNPQKTPEQKQLFNGLREKISDLEKAREKDTADLTSIWNKAQEGKGKGLSAEMKGADETLLESGKKVPGVESKMAIRTEKAAMDEGLTNKQFGNLAGYEKEEAFMKAQEKNAQQIIAKNYNSAVEIAMGSKEPPDGVTAQSMYKYVEQEAIKRGDLETLYKLGTESTVPSETSRLGQQIKSADVGTDESPLKAMQDIREARATMVERAGKKIDPKQQAEEINRLNKELEVKQKALDEHLAKVETRKVNSKIDEITKEFKPRVKYGSRNKIVTQDEYLKTKAELRQQFGSQLNIGIDPTIIAKLSKVGAYHLEAGARGFADWSARVVADVGGWAKPHLKEVWENTQTVVKKAKVDDFTKRVTKAKEKGADLPDIGILVNNLARQFVEDGIKDRDSLVKAVHDVIKDAIPGITPRETADAISGYGKYKLLSKDEVSKQLRDIKGQLQQVSKLEDLQSKGSADKTGIERRTPSDEERRLINLVNEAKKKYGIEVDPETKLKTSLQSLKTRLINEEKKLTERFNNRDFAVKEKTKAREDMEARFLRNKRDQAKKNLQAGTKIGNISKDEAKKLIGLSKVSLDAKEKLDAGGDDFMKNLLDYKTKSIAFDDYTNELKGDTRTKYQKALAYEVKWRRFLLLSSIKTVGKLTNAAMSRFVTTTAEDAMAGFWRKVPGVSKVFEKSPRFSSGFNAKATAKAFRQFVEKQTYKDIYSMGKEGKSSLNVMMKDIYSDGNPPSKLDFFGHLHGALKVLPNRAEFYNSLERITEFETKHGTNMESPIEQMRVCMESFEEANRAILMRKNVATNMYTEFLNMLRRHGKGGETTAATLQNLMPIVRVPTNYVSEVSNYTLGLPKGIAQTMHVLIKKDAIEALTRQQANNIARSLSKGSIGAAVFLIGYYNDQNLGGYYQPGEKRNKADVAWGGVRVGDREIPHWLLHIPVMEVAQIGATAHRVIRAKGSYLRAAYRSAMGLASQVPFLEQPTRMATALKNEKTAGKFMTELGASMVIPPDVSNAAQLMDQDKQGKTIKRKAQTPEDIIKLKIPGLRKEVRRQ
jgi:hypothetical protein